MDAESFKKVTDGFKEELDECLNIHQLNALDVEFNAFMRTEKLCLLGFEDRWERLSN